MSSAAQKPKKKKEDLEREQLLKDAYRADVIKEAALYSAGYAQKGEKRVLRLFNEQNIKKLADSAKFEDTRTHLFVQLHEAGALGQVSEKAFVLLASVSHKLLQAAAERREQDLGKIELAGNFVASQLLRDPEFSRPMLDLSNPEELDKFVESNFASGKSITAKIGSGFFEYLLKSHENEEINVFKAGKDAEYSFTKLDERAMKEWLADYIDVVGVVTADESALIEEAVLLVERLFLKLKHAFQCYLNQPEGVQIVNETKIVDQPLIFEERAVQTQFPLRSIESCLFKMKNDPIDPNMFDNIKHVERQASEEAEPVVDEWAGLDEADIEEIKRQLDEYRAAKDQELAAKVEEANNKKGRGKRK